MPTIEITGWHEFVGFTGWDDHVRSEIRKRLRRGVNASPGEIRRLARQINDRHLVSLQRVHEDAIYGITQILQTMGADFRVSLTDEDNA